MEDLRREERLKEAETPQDTVCATESVSPLRARLQSDLGNLSEQIFRSGRADEILAKHPEFEELIELLGLIRVPIRFSPIHSDRALVLA